MNPLLKLSLLVPVYNEELSIDPFLDRVINVFFSETKISIEIIFVNDGSIDGTLDRLINRQKISKDIDIKIIDLSRNFGKEAALSAALEFASGDVVVPIDVDLQDPPELILHMLEKWREGYEVVIAKRVNRDSDSVPKRIFSLLFYKVHNGIASSKIPENVGDFRLMDRQVVDCLKLMPETNRFMKGLFAWVGFKTAQINYSRPARFAGTTKFNGWKLWNFAIEGLTSFSTAPLRVWMYVGIGVSFFAFSFVIFIAVRVLILGIDVPGYASLMCAITFLGGLQLIGIGVIGEYLGRAYIESKRRPLFLIRKIYVEK